MSETVKPVPDGFNTVSAYLVVSNAVQALEFYNKALGAEMLARMPGPDGRSTMHAEIRIGNSTVMLTDENPEWNMKSPLTLGGSGASLHLYVEDADAPSFREPSKWDVLQPCRSRMSFGVIAMAR
ncbi:MAG: VOC family protein [Acidobacteriota bacterium]